MSAKSKVSQEAPAKKSRSKKKPELPQAPVLEAVLRLSDTDKLSLNWLDAESRALSSEARLKQVELNEYIAKVDPIGKIRALQNEIGALMGNATRKKTQFVEHCKQVADTLGIDKSRQWSFNDETGVVHLLEEEKDLPKEEEPK